MLTLRTSLIAAGLALALSSLSPLPAGAQTTVARWRGSGNEQLIEQAVRRFGYTPGRLTDAQVRAINDAWTELLGATTRRAPLNETQATAIVYMALVHPNGGRPGAGSTPPARPQPRPLPWTWDAECDQMQADAYRLGNLISAPASNGGLFVAEPERGRARALARQIQERAVQCRALAAADRAGDVMATLSDSLPYRTTVEARVDALKRAIQEATPGPRR